MKRLSTSPTANHTTQDEARLATIAFARSCLRSYTTATHITKEHVLPCSQLQLSRHATYFPVIGHTNTTCSQQPRPRLSHANCSATGTATRQHVECNPRICIRRRIERGTCVERSRNRKGHTPPRTHPARLLGTGQSRRVCERPHLGKRQLIAVKVRCATGSESFSSRRTTLLNPMSVSSGLKRPHQKWMARDTCRSSSQSCRCAPMFGSGFCSNEI